jgi:hypothetical protein
VCLKIGVCVCVCVWYRNLFEWNYESFVLRAFFITCAFVFNYLLFFILFISLHDFIEDDIFAAVAMNFIVLWNLTTQKTF